MKSIIPIDRGLEENKRYCNKLFRNLKKFYKIDTPADEIQLNLLVTDLLRLKEAYARMVKSGQFQSVKSKAGNVYDGVSPIGFYINQLEGSIRSQLRELMMTRKSAAKKKQQDFASFATEVIDVEPTNSSKEVRNKSEGKA